MGGWSECVCGGKVVWSVECVRKCGGGRRETFFNLPAESRRQLPQMATTFPPSTTTIKTMAAVPVPTPTQDAILIPRYLKSIDELQVTKVPIPGEPSDFECLIDVAYTNIAFADILLIQGLYQNKPECPFVPGTGFAGVVVKTGKEAGKKFKPGDRCEREQGSTAVVSVQTVFF